MTSFFSFTLFFWQCWVFIAARGLSPVADRGDCSLVAVHGLLIAAASLLAEHVLQGEQSQWLQLADFRVCGFQ